MLPNRVTTIDPRQTIEDRTDLSSNARFLATARPWTAVEIHSSRARSDAKRGKRRRDVSTDLVDPSFQVEDSVRGRRKRMGRFWLSFVVRRDESSENQRWKDTTRPERRGQEEGGRGQKRARGKQKGRGQGAGIETERQGPKGGSEAIVNLQASSTELVLRNRFRPRQLYLLPLRRMQNCSRADSETAATSRARAFRGPWMDVFFGGS